MLFTRAIGCELCLIEARYTESKERKDRPGALLLLLLLLLYV
jgi:hypothetical protein